MGRHAKADDPSAVTEDNPGELAHWLIGYIQDAHPDIYREALRARGDEVSRRAARKHAHAHATLQEVYGEALREGEIHAGSVVTDTLDGNRWRVTRKFHNGTQMSADVESTDGVKATFLMEDLEMDSDQSWPSGA